MSSLRDLDSFRPVWLPIFRPYGTWIRFGQFGYQYFVPTGLGFVQASLVTNISSLWDLDSFRSGWLPILRPYGTLDEAVGWLPIYHPYGIARNKKNSNPNMHGYNHLPLLRSSPWGVQHELVVPVSQRKLMIRLLSRFISDSCYSNSKLRI